MSGESLSLSLTRSKLAANICSSRGWLGSPSPPRPRWRDWTGWWRAPTPGRAPSLSWCSSPTRSSTWPSCTSPTWGPATPGLETIWPGASSTPSTSRPELPTSRSRPASPARTREPSCRAWWGASTAARTTPSGGRATTTLRTIWGTWPGTTVWPTTPSP